MSDIFDRRIAPLLGKRALVGVTYVEPSGERLIQFHGVIVRAVEGEGIYLRCGDEEVWLPPDPSSFRPALPGRYALKTTGEIVADPDFTAVWRVHPPK